MFINQHRKTISLRFQRQSQKIKIVVGTAIILGALFISGDGIFAHAQDNQVYSANLELGTSYSDYSFIPGQLCSSGPGAIGSSWTPSAPDISQIHLLNSASDPTIDGTPTIPGSWTFNFYCPDASTGSVTFNVPQGTSPDPVVPSTNPPKPKKQPHQPILHIKRKCLVKGIIGSSYSDTFIEKRGTAPYKWSVVTGSLPKGLSLNSSTGILSGKPQIAGDLKFTVQVKDAKGAVSDRVFSINIKK
jgi:hypothetical protein